MSHTKRMRARTNGLKPAFLNLSMLVSAPKAVIAIVSRNVSNVFIKFTTPSGNKSRELKPITTRKRIANQGTSTLPLSPYPIAVFAVLIMKKPMISKTGTSIITRIIFTMIAGCDTLSPIALPAPTTCATS